MALLPSALTRPRIAFAAAVAAVGLLAAACGSSTTATSSPTTAGSTGAPTSASGPATISVLKSPTLGDILRAANGYTVYLFTKDTGTTSTCTGGCLSIWPPVTVTGQPIAGSGVTASALGTTGSGTTKQVTYHGHPLYFFAHDTSAGQTAGQGINGSGGRWYVVSPAGTAVTQATATSSTTAATGY